MRIFLLVFFFLFSIFHFHFFSFSAMWIGFEDAWLARRAGANRPLLKIRIGVCVEAVAGRFLGGGEQGAGYGGRGWGKVALVWFLRGLENGGCGDDGGGLWGVWTIV